MSQQESTGSHKKSWKHLAFDFARGCVISAVVGTLLTFVLHAVDRTVIEKINWDIVFTAKNYDFHAVLYNATAFFYDYQRSDSTIVDPASGTLKLSRSDLLPPPPGQYVKRELNLQKLFFAPISGPMQTFILVTDAWIQGWPSFLSMLLSLAVGFGLVAVALWRLHIVSAKTDTYIWVSVSLWLAPFAGAAFLSALFPLITATSHLFGHLSAAVTEFAAGLPLLRTLFQALNLDELPKRLMEAGEEGVHSHTEHEIASKVEKRLAKEG